MRTVAFFSLVLVLAGVFGSCRYDPMPAATDLVTREVRPNGSVYLRYSSLPESQKKFVKTDLRIGVADGDVEYIFGDVRGIDAGSDGTIYVLDYQARELRAFSPDGEFDRLVMSGGSGPAEITEANGFVLVGDSILWVQDHSKFRMIGVGLDGAEKLTVPMQVLSYGYVWNGAIDQSGMIWKPHASHQSSAANNSDEGLQIGTGLAFAKGLDPLTGRTDSIAFGLVRYRSFVQKHSNGWSHMRIPFDEARITRIEPSGGFWSAHNNRYRLERFDRNADTLVTIDVDVKPIPVTADDRREFIEQLEQSRPGSGNVGSEIAALMNDTKPVWDDLVVDSESRLWVRRSTERDAGAQFDVFDREGTFLSTITMDVAPVPYLSIRVRNSRIYALTMDSLGIPIVVRSETFSL